MKNLLILIAVIVLGVAGYQYMQNPSQTTDSMQSEDAMMQDDATSNDAASMDDAQDTAMQVDVAMEDGTIAMETTTYTMAQVAQHNDATSCWSAIDGNVYDLTSWIDQHPGGDKNILKICGIDGTSAFNSKHGESAKAQVKREEFLLGALAQ